LSDSIESFKEYKYVLDVKHEDTLDRFDKDTIVDTVVDTDTDTNTNPNPMDDITYVIAVITSANTSSRFNSLKRLLNSLLKAHYPPSVTSHRTSISLRFSCDSNTSPEVLSYITNLAWPHGKKSVYNRIKRGGLVTAVSESWYPSHDMEHAIILEDDIELSVYYFMYLEKVLKAHYSYYGQEPGRKPGRKLGRKPDRNVIGIAMYTPKTVENISDKRFPLDTESMRPHNTQDTHLFKYSLPCSWGALWFPSAWEDFIVYMRKRLELEDELGYDNTVVSVPNSLSVVWFGSWKKYMFELMYTKNLFMIYPNFPQQASFSTNHMELGEHISSEKDRESRLDEFLIPLVTEEYANDLADTGVISIAPGGSIVDSLPSTLDDLLLMDTSSRPLITSECLSSDTCREKAPPTTWHRTTVVSSLLNQNSRDAVCNRKIGKYTLPFHDNYLMKTDTKISLLLTSDAASLAITRLQIEYYSYSPRVAAIIVTWHDSLNPPPPSVRLGDVFVTFRASISDLLSNSFHPSSKIITDGVISMEGNVRVHLEDIELLYQSLKSHSDSVVGFSLAGLSDGNVGGSNYESPGYSVMSGAVVAFHSNYLQLFSCDAGMETIHGMIDYSGDYADVALSIFMSAVTKLAAPLYVEPTHHVARFGSSKKLPLQQHTAEGAGGGGGNRREAALAQLAGGRPPRNPAESSAAERREYYYGAIEQYFFDTLKAPRQDMVISLDVSNLEFGGKAELSDMTLEAYESMRGGDALRTAEFVVECEAHGAGGNLWRVADRGRAEAGQRQFAREDADWLDTICGADGWEVDEEAEAKTTVGEFIFVDQRLGG
jgi:hypothetical protein